MVHAALDAGITLFDTADIYGHRGGSEEMPGQDPRRAAQGHRARHQVRHGDGRRRQQAGRIARLHHEGSRRQPAAGCRPTTSTSTRCTSSIRSRRSTRRCARSTISCAPARCATSAARTSRPGGWRPPRNGRRNLGTERFISFQDELSLVVRHNEKDVMPCGEHYGMGMLPFFPLASGLADRQVQEGCHAGRRTHHRDRSAHQAIRHRAELPRSSRNSRRSPQVRPHADRTGIQLARRQAGDRERHRRRDEAGAGRAERQGAELVACRLDELAEIDRITLPAAA